MVMVSSCAQITMDCEDPEGLKGKESRSCWMHEETGWLAGIAQADWDERYFCETQRPGKFFLLPIGDFSKPSAECRERIVRFSDLSFLVVLTRFILCSRLGVALRWRLR